MSTPADPNTTLRLTRIFKAPRDRVYAAWTDPAQMQQWFAPEGVETIRWQLDLRVGGKWRWDLRAPDGEEMSAFGEYREIRPGEKLVHTWKWDDDPTWESIDSLVTIEFRDHPEGTELRLSHERLPSEQSRDNHRGAGRARSTNSSGSWPVNQRTVPLCRSDARCTAWRQITSPTSDFGVLTALYLSIYIIYRGPLLVTKPKIYQWIT